MTSITLALTLLTLILCFSPRVEAKHSNLQAILFTDAAQNAKWFNWILFIYGIPHGLISELAYFYNYNDCLTGMLMIGNGVLGMSVYANLHFTDWWDWI